MSDIPRIIVPPILPPGGPRAFPCVVCGSPVAADREPSHLVVDATVYPLCPGCAQVVGNLMVTLAVAARNMGKREVDEAAPLPPS